MVTATHLKFPSADGLDKQLGTTGETIGDTFLIYLFVCQLSENRKRLRSQKNCTIPLYSKTLLNVQLKLWVSYLSIYY